LTALLGAVAFALALAANPVATRGCRAGALMGQVSLQLIAVHGAARHELATTAVSDCCHLNSSLDSCSRL
jgi:hypothetical protein